ncbi:MAG: OadG-related small transporter subunit [Eubacterium sp.]
MLDLFNFLSITMAINASSWKETIPVMIFGMVGIFLVIGVIIIATYLINKVFSKKKKDDKDK